MQENMEKQTGTQKEDGFGNSGFREGSGGDLAPILLLPSLLVYVQKNNHGATDPKHEFHPQDIRK